MSVTDEVDELTFGIVEDLTGKKLTAEDKERLKKMDEWNPEPGHCECGCLHLWHQLREPHKCNECDKCTGYKVVKKWYPAGRPT